MQTLEELYEEKKRIEEGLRSPFWAQVKQFVQGQITLRRQQLFANRIKGLDEAFAAAHTQSEVAGLQFALAIPHILLDDLQADINRLLEQEREQEPEETGK